MSSQVESLEMAEECEQDGHQAMNPKGGVSKFPVELVCICADYMDPVSASRFSRTCKGFAETIKDMLKKKVKEFAMTPEDPDFTKYHGAGVFVPMLGPMVQAMIKGRIDALRGFLKAGVSANSFDDFPESLLSSALRFDQIDAAKLLLEYNADPCIGDMRDNTTPLHMATVRDGPRSCMIEPFIRAGAMVTDTFLLVNLCRNQENALKYMKLAVMNGSDLSKITTESTHQTVLFLLPLHPIGLRVADFILHTWPELLNRRVESYGTVLYHVLRFPQKPSLAIYFLDRGSDLIGGELQQAIYLDQGSTKDAILTRLLAHPQIDLNAYHEAPWGLGKSGTPLSCAWTWGNFDTAEKILEHPALRIEAKDFCDMIDAVECWGEGWSPERRRMLRMMERRFSNQWRTSNKDHLWLVVTGYQN